MLQAVQAGNALDNRQTQPAAGHFLPRRAEKALLHPGQPLGSMPGPLSCTTSSADSSSAIRLPAGQ
jgi:hypothetical protein